ncbi:MAG: hypothetical protein MK175_04140 [Pseudoalteromonas sp.]|uniref:hypothetical protein n=1 Tax=Pseudoalteromonas sp. TaxID=53249 RepID=UPI0025D60865|nr:hypothetical protein [Pseudoalteromonas sp.]MCH2086356.1 hypothetical protein [Pseudoalteromonas sp.]
MNILNTIIKHSIVNLSRSFRAKAVKMVDSVSSINGDIQGFAPIQTTREFSYQLNNEWFDLIVVYTPWGSPKYFVKLRHRKADKPVLQERSKEEVIELLYIFIGRKVGENSHNS